MSRNVYRAALISAAFAALFLAWATTSPWVSAVRGSSERYKVSLFGVWYVTSSTSTVTTEARCDWDDPSPRSACAAAAGHTTRHAWLGYARWFVIGAVFLACVGLIALGRERIGFAAVTFLLGGLATVAAILIVRMNTRLALGVLTDARRLIDSSGLNAAQMASSLMFVSAVLLITPNPKIKKPKRRRPITSRP